MLLKIDNIKTSINASGLEVLMDDVCKKIKIDREKLNDFYIIRKSLDARKKPSLFYNFSIAFTVKDKKTEKKVLRNRFVSTYEKPKYSKLMTGEKVLDKPIAIVGSGPAGLFAAYLLAEYGYKPWIFERGADMQKRIRDVKEFWDKGHLDINSNVQFGMGGAGTFSDAKLTSRSKDTRVNKVYDIFIENGAKKEIAYEKKPHLGTDAIRKIVVNMQNRIESLGGKFFFESAITDIGIQENDVKTIEVNQKDVYEIERLVLACGHSARDTFEMLHGNEVELEKKSFAVGFRIEHPQDLIDLKQLGSYSGDLGLSAAEYKLSYKDSKTNRGVYSFCMCPGGMVVNASSEEKHLCINGMSYSKRDTKFANSAIVVTIDKEDFDSDNPLVGMKYQQALEKKAFELGGNNYMAPCQKVSDFLDGATGEKVSTSDVSFKPGVANADLHNFLEIEKTECMRRALIDFNRKIPGFTGENAYLIAVETRTSSPVRIPRNENMESVSTRGLHPVGEGAGYAGGIVSAAVDGLKVAEVLIGIYRRD